MELSLLPLQQPPLLPKFFNSSPITRTRYCKKSVSAFPCRCSSDPSKDSEKALHFAIHEGRRPLMSCFLAAAAGICVSGVARAVSTSRRALRGAKIPESEYITLSNGLKYYDLKVGGGTKAVKGSRVAVHYVAKWKGITFMTSRQGLGVGGGTRLLIIPPELAYGSKGVQEIPPNATIELDVELLAIKESPFGSAVKIVEG